MIMSDLRLKEQILKAIFRKIGDETTKNVLIIDLKIGFDNIEKDKFFDALKELIEEGLIYERGRGGLTFTPDGLDKAMLLINPPPTINQNTLNIGHAVNSPVQQGIQSYQQQTINYELPKIEELHQLVEFMCKNLSELKLPPAAEKKAKAQLATIEAQLIDEPNPSIIKEAGKTLRNVTEGAVGSILANAAQPGVWAVVQSILAMF